MDGDTLVVVACTQAPYMDRDDTAKVLGLAADKVRIVPTATGGGFGSKLDVSLQPLIGLVALKTGRPAALAYTRDESMMSTTKRHPAEMTATIGADADGHVTGMVFDGDFNTGAYASWGPTVANRVPVHASGPYATPNYRAEGRAIHTNGPISGAFRGFGVPQATIMQETLYDELAGKLGIDRLEFRLKNCLRNGSETVTGQRLESGVGIAECLEALQPHWARALADADASTPPTQTESAASASPPAGMAAATPRCPTRRPSGSASRPTGDGRPAPGRRRYRPGLQHRHHPDLRRRARPAAGKIPAEERRHGDHARRRQDLGLAPDLRHRQGGREGRPRLARKDPALRQCLGPRLRCISDGAAIVIREGEAVRRIDLATLDGRCRRAASSRAEETYDPPTAAARRQGPGQALCRLWLRRADRRTRGRPEARHGEAAQDHRRARCRPGDQPAAGRGPDRGRHRAGHRHGADGGIHSRPHRESARLSHPDHRRRAADRDHPGRGSRPGRTVRRQGPGRACADPDRAGDPQRHPPRHRRADHQGAGDTDAHLRCDPGARGGTP